MPLHTAQKTTEAWPAWAAFLRRYGLENLAAWLLDSGGPLAILGAQLLYMGGPLLQPLVERRKLENLAMLLEDREEGSAFLSYLQEETG